MVPFNDAHRAGSGAPDATNEKGWDAVNVATPDITNLTDDSAAKAERDQHDKRVKNAQARAAIAGYQLHIVGDCRGGSFFQVSRWNLSRSLPTIEAVEEFLTRAGA